MLDCGNCSFVIPEYMAHYITYDHELNQLCDFDCLLRQWHEGYHLYKLPHGKYLALWDGSHNNCDDSCNWCGECVSYEFISAAEAEKILKEAKI